MDMDLIYDFRLTAPAERVTVGINASKGAERVLSACLTGVRRELTDGALLKWFSSISLITLKVTLAIHREALRLWLKGIRLRNKPSPPVRNATLAVNTSKHGWIPMSTETQQTIPKSVDTARTLAPSALLNGLMQHIIRKIDCGEILLQTPGGQHFMLRAKRAGERAHVVLHRCKCMLPLLGSGDLGFAEGYLAGEWSTPNYHS